MKKSLLLRLVIAGAVASAAVLATALLAQADSWSDSADLFVKTTASASANHPGTASFTTEITNRGPSTATDVTLTLPIPAQAEWVSLTTYNNESCAGRTLVTCKLGDLAPKQSSTVKIRLKGLSNGLVQRLPHSAVALAQTTDPDPTNNSTTSGCMVQRVTRLGGLCLSSQVSLIGKESTSQPRIINGSPQFAPTCVTAGRTLTVTLAADSTTALRIDAVGGNLQYVEGGEANALSGATPWTFCAATGSINDIDINGSGGIDTLRIVANNSWDATPVYTSVALAGGNDFLDFTVNDPVEGLNLGLGDEVFDIFEGSGGDEDGRIVNAENTSATGGDTGDVVRLLSQPRQPPVPVSVGVLMPSGAVSTFTREFLFTGGLGDDEFLGGDGNDVINAGPGDDLLGSGEGNDTFLQGATPDGLDDMDGGSGADLVDYADRIGDVEVSLGCCVGNQGEAGEGDTIEDVENASTGAGSDQLTGSHGDNILKAGAGNDIVSLAGGRDIVDGGDGTDRISFATSVGVAVDLINGTASEIGGGSSGGLDTIGNFEDITGSPSSDVLIGNAGANRIEGLAGDDIESGGSGADTFQQGAAPDDADSMSGGGGVDMVDYGERTTDIYVDINGVGDDGAGVCPTSATCEHDDVQGDIEVVRTGSGNDTFVGDDSPETFIGGLRDDFFDGNGGCDTWDFSAASDVTVDVVAGTATGEGSDTFTEVENFLGASFDDSMIDLKPATATNPPGTSHTITAIITDQGGAPAPGVNVDFLVTGRNPSGRSGFDMITDASGKASFTYSDTGPLDIPGKDTIVAWVDFTEDDVLNEGGSRDDVCVVPEPKAVAMKLWERGLEIVIDPASATNPTGTSHTVTATVTDLLGDPVPDANVDFLVTSRNSSGASGFDKLTDASGHASFTYSDTGPLVSLGTDEILAWVDVVENDEPGDIVEGIDAASTEPEAEATKEWVPAVDLSIRKTDSPDPVALFGELTYTITVANSAERETAAENVVVEDTLPTDVEFVSASGECSQTVDGKVICNLGTIPSGSKATVTIVVTPTDAGKISNTAAVTSTTDELDPNNNVVTSETAVVGVADLSITKEATPKSVSPNDEVTYELTVTNLGPHTATDVVVTDTLPDAVTFKSIKPEGLCSGKRILTCRLGDIDADASPIAITIVAKAKNAGTIENTAFVSGETLDPNLDDNHASAATTVQFSPQLVLMPSIGEPGSVTIAVGSGFPADHKITLDWDQGIGTLQVRTTSEGTFAAPIFIFNGDLLGERVLTVSGQDNLFKPVHASFLVITGSAQPSKFLTRR